MSEKTGSFRPEPGEGYFSGLVALSVRSPANRIATRFPVNLLLELDEHILEVAPQPGFLQRVAQRFSLPSDSVPPPIRLAIRLRHCTVRYLGDGVSVITETKYRSPIEVGKYTESMSEHEKEKRESNVSANSTLKAGATLTRPILSAQGQVAASDDWRGNNSTERAIKVTKDLYEVEAIPNGWRVGDRRLGDPLKRGAFLSGPYFGRPQPDYHYTCWLEFAGQANAASLTVVVAVHDGLQVERLDGHMATDNDLDAAERVMRDKLAAIRIERDAAAAGALPDAGSEMPLYTVVCRCERGDDLGAEVSEAPRLVPSPPALLEGSPPRPAAKAKRSQARSPRAKP